MCGMHKYLFKLRADEKKKKLHSQGKNSLLYDRHVSLGQIHILNEGTSASVTTCEPLPYQDKCIYNYKVYHIHYLDIEFNGRIVSL